MGDIDSLFVCSRYVAEERRTLITIGGRPIVALEMEVLASHFLPP